MPHVPPAVLLALIIRTRAVFCTISISMLHIFIFCFVFPESIGKLNYYRLLVEINRIPFALSEMVMGRTALFVMLRTLAHPCIVKNTEQQSESIIKQRIIHVIKSMQQNAKY